VLSALLAALCLIGAGPAFAVAPPDAGALNAYAADRLLPFWRQYTARYEDDEAPFVPAYRLDPAPEGAISHSGFWLEAPGGGLTALGVDAHGYLVLPERAREAGFVGRDTRLFHAPDRPLPAIRLEIHATLAPARRYAMGDLSALASEMDRFQRAAMGFAALMAPRFDVVVFHFEGPAPDGWHVTRRGDQRTLGALHDTLFLRMTGRVARMGGEVVLDAAPARIVLEAR
jgi:hypothetical protein